METKSARTPEIRYIALGAIAAFLYGSTVFSLFFAMPLQTSWSRGGYRAFLVSLAAALTGVAAWLLWQYRGLPLGGVGGLLMMLSLPAGLAGAMALVNAGFLAGLPLVYRILTGSLVVIAIALPSVYSLFANADVQAFLLKGIEEMTRTMDSVGGEGYAGAVLRSNLEPRVMLEAARRVIADAFAAVLFAFTFAGHWFGTRAAGADAPGARRLPALSSFSVPGRLIWAFIGSWSAVLALRLQNLSDLRAAPVLEALAWNAALAVSFCYAVQGLGILRHVLERVAPTGPLRWTGILLVVLLLFNLRTGAWTAGILSVLGATENWIPYRISKGVQT